MCPTRILLFLALSFAGGGCADEGSTLLAPDQWIDGIETLDFTAPDIASPPSGEPSLPVLVDTPEQEDTESPDGIARPLQQIFRARTKTGFWPGRAWAEGANQYIGNVGRIETTAKVTFEQQPLAEQPVLLQDYVPFIFDFGGIKFITAFAPVSTDHVCGLSVYGSSEHGASWQFFTGSGAPAWGEAIVTTVAQHSAQDPCPDFDAGPVGIIGSGPGGSTCYFRITYDLDTGRVISTELLYCTPSTGEGL